MPDWTQFTRQIYIAAPIQTVYDAWTKPELITTWYLDKADYFDSNGKKRAPDEYLEIGDTYEWKWHNWDAIEKGKVLKADAPNEIRFSFASDQCEVSINLESIKGKTLVRLSQSNIPLDEKSKLELFNGCSLGWSFWMVNLKAWLEHGILLNDRSLGGEKQVSQFVNS